MKFKFEDFLWSVVIGGLLVGLFFWMSQYNSDLFHSVVGTATVVLGVCVAMVTINARRWLNGQFFMALAIGLLFVSMIDFFQTLAIAEVSPVIKINEGQYFQLWTFSSLMMAISFLVAFVFAEKRIRDVRWLIPVYTMSSVLIVVSICLDWINFSTNGLPLNTIISLSVLIIYGVSVLLGIRLKDRFEEKSWHFIMWSMLLLMASLIISNLPFDFIIVDSLADIGRFFGYFCLYQGLVVVAINNPETFIFNEISQKQAELQRANENLKIYKYAMEGASDHVIITDTNGKIIFVNRAAEQITGYSSAEMIGKTPALWGKRMPLEYYQKMWQTIKVDKQPFHGEITNKRKNGEEYTAKIHITPIINDKGELVNFLGLEQDVSHQKVVDKMKSEFITVASHQLRTPLSASKWYLEMFTNKDFGEYNEKQSVVLRDLTSSNERMIQIVNGLLDVSRIEAGSLKVTPEEVETEKLITNVLLLSEPLIEASQIEVVKMIDPMATKIITDQKLTNQILKVLIGNGCIYSPIKGKLSISVKKDDKFMLFSIKDQGVGIPASEQDKVFTRFFRGSNAVKVVTEGSGLGLYFARELVEAMGGTIGFESTEGVGSTFWFKLPLEMTEKPGFVSLDT